MSRLHTETEPLATLRARYARALEYIYDLDRIDAGGIRPAEVAANRFAFEDGFMLLVSRERFGCGQVHLHVWAKLHTESELYQRFARGELGAEKVLREFAKLVPQRFRELSNDDRPLIFMGWAKNFSPHYSIPEGDISHDHFGL